MDRADFDDKHTETQGSFPMSIKKSITAVAIATAFATMPAAAQGQGQGQGGAAAQAVEQSFSEEKLQAFAEAAATVTPIIVQAQKKMAGTKDQAKRQKVMEKMRGDMRSSIEDSPNITMEEYQAITMKARQNPEFRSKVQAMLKKEMGEQGQGS